MCSQSYTLLTLHFLAFKILILASYDCTHNYGEVKPDPGEIFVLCFAVVHKKRLQGSPS